MTNDSAMAIATPNAATALPRAVNAAVTAENALLALAFLATVALPLAEIVLRATLHVGIEGAAAIVQHLTLAVGMLGAAVAAREERMLTLAVQGFIRGPGAPAARFASAAVGAAVTLLLFLASLDFVAAEHAAGSRFVLGVPVWVAQLPLPLGYGLIALRLAWRAAPAPAGRVAAAAIVAAAVAWLRLLPPDMSLAVLPVLCMLALATVLGAPIFVAIGGAVLFLLQGDGVPAAAVAVNHYSLVINPSLPAIPMFTLAGYLLAESRAPGRLVELFDAFFGRLRGGAAIVTVLACTFFTSFTGASGVTILALGGLVMPLLARSGYRPQDALALVTGAGFRA